MCNWVTMLYRRKMTEHRKPATMKKKKSSLTELKIISQGSFFYLQQFFCTSIGFYLVSFQR